MLGALRYESEVRGSIPDDVSDTFHWHNPYGHTAAPGRLNF